MKSLARAVAALALVFGLSGVANAQQHPFCTLNTLRGTYVFTASGTYIAGGVPQPKAIVEVIEFEGDGTLTVGAVTVSINGSMTQVPAGGSVYTHSRRTARVRLPLPQGRRTTSLPRHRRRPFG